MRVLEQFLNWAEENQWKLEMKKENTSRTGLPPETAQRYGEIPADFTEFLGAVKSLSNKGRTAWFICEDDFGADAPSYACRWNEPELMSLDAAQGDGALVGDIRKWWDGRLPVMLVRGAGGYEYYALDLDNGGAVVHGAEPQFEDAKTVAPSFEEFLKKIMAGEAGL